MDTTRRTIVIATGTETETATGTVTGKENGTAKCVATVTTNGKRKENAIATNGIARTNANVITAMTTTSTIVNHPSSRT